MIDIYLWGVPLAKLCILALIGFVFYNSFKIKKHRYKLLALGGVLLLFFLKISGTYEPKNRLDSFSESLQQGTSKSFNEYNNEIDGFEERKRRIEKQAQ